MATPDQVARVLNVLTRQMLACPEDGTRLRFGDYECPHCGADLEEHLRAFAAYLVDTADGSPPDP